VKNPLHDPIEVEVGREFAIPLASNPTTGYRWDFIEPVDGRIVEFVESEYKGQEGERKGAGGEEIFAFRAVSQGTAKISLGYARWWERNPLPIQTQTFKVVVRPP
jgi:inhibitor of cysteine peptidase